eukprot:5323600-Prymnesium_polylepis.1
MAMARYNTARARHERAGRASGCGCGVSIMRWPEVPPGGGGGGSETSSSGLASPSRMPRRSGRSVVTVMLALVRTGTLGARLGVAQQDPAEASPHATRRQPAKMESDLAKD